MSRLTVKSLHRVTCCATILRVSCTITRHAILYYATCNATVRRAWVRLQCANLRAKARIRSGYQSLPKLIHEKNEILQSQFAYLKI